MSTWTSNYSYRKVCKIIYKVATYHIQHALSKRETLIHTVACFRLCFMSLSFTRRSLISDTAKHNHELPTWTELLQLLLTMILVKRTFRGHAGSKAGTLATAQLKFKGLYEDGRLLSLLHERYAKLCNLCTSILLLTFQIRQSKVLSSI